MKENVCKTCGQIFYRKIKQKYCNWSCYHKATIKRTSSEKICEGCGKTFSWNLTMTRWATRKYCTEKCFRKVKEEAFWKAYKVDEKMGCWLWTRSDNGRGYGRLTRKGHTLYVHRLFYEKYKKTIPNGLEIDHLCKNRLCVNPAHLEAVTRYENWLRSDSISLKKKLQTHCQNGHPFDEKNTRIVYQDDRRLGRVCRICHCLYERRRRERLKIAA